MTFGSANGPLLILGEVRGGVISGVTWELTGKARQLADEVDREVVLLLMSNGFKNDPAGDGYRGADRVIDVRHPSLDLFNQEVQAKVLLEVLRNEQPSMVLAPATSSGRTVMPIAAAGAKTGLTADCTWLEIEAETGLLLQTRPAIGGNVMATIRTPDHLPQMATVRPRTFAPPEPDPDRKADVEKPLLPDECFESRVEALGFTPHEEDAVNIQDMDVVVAGGKGLQKAESFSMLRELAALLKGGVGASRVAVDNRWIGYPHQVGLSGKVVAPRVYIAAGISGSVQHMAGMQTSEYVVAINKDPEAPIFKTADLALCGDLFDIVPRIIAAVRRAKEEVR